MNRTTILFVLLLGLAVLLFLFNFIGSDSTSLLDEATNSDMPLSNGSGSVTVPTEELLGVRNFLNDPDVVADSENEGYYFLGNHYGQSFNSELPYIIQYIADTNHFTISLLQRPLVQSRRDAEQYLMNKLRLTTDEMCALNYVVSTPHWVDEVRGGASLGFSFCPGSVSLQ